VLIDPGCPGGADVEPFEPQPASATAVTRATMSLRIVVTSINDSAVSIRCRS
jgi:hypothetical protein